MWGDVASHIAPVLAGLDRLGDKLDAVQNKFRNTGREAGQMGARVSVGMRVAETAIDKVTRAWDRQTAAISRNTAARIANANAPTGDGPSGGGGGGGARTVDRRTISNVVNNYTYNTYNYDNSTTNNGPPSPPGGGGGGGRGALGLITSPARLGGIALAAQALPALATGVVNIVGAVQQLAQAGLALPGIFAGGAATIGTVLVGTKGIGDAVKELNKAMEDGDPTKIAEAQKSLEKLAPAAAEVATKLADLTQGKLKDFQKAIAQPLLEGLAPDIGKAADRILPRAQAGMEKVAKALNVTAKTALGELGSDQTLSFMDRIFGNTAEGQSRANAAIKPLIHAGGQLAAISSDFLPRLGDALAKVADRLDRFISKNANNGNLFRWIDEGLNGARSFGNAILNVGKIITGLTKAAGQAKGSLSGDGGFLGGLERFTDKWANFVNSPAGQKTLGDFFAGGTADLGKWADLLGSLGPVLGSVYEGFETWGKVLLPIVSTVGDLLNQLNQIPGLLETIVVGFLAFKTLNGVIGGLTGAIGGGGAGGGTGLVGALGKLKSLGVIGGAGLAITGAMDQQQNGLTGTNALETIGGGALLGASLGGPWGAAIGALVGTGVSLFSKARQQLEDGKAEWEKSWQEHHDNPNRPGNLQAQLDDNPALRGRMNPSLFNPDGSAKPTIPGALTDKLTSGGLPGYSVGPDGLVRGPGGQVVNLPPGLLDPSKLPKGPPPPPPVLSPEAQKLVTEGTPVASGAPAADAKLQGTAQAAKAAFDNVQLLSQAVTTLPGGEVVLKDNAPEAIKRVEELGYAVKKLPDGQVAIAVQYMYNGSPISLEQLRTPIRVAATPGGTVPTVGGGRAGGGVLPGYSPGVDNMLVPMSGGEGVLIPEAVRGIGGAAAVYAINSRFRAGLSRRGYAEGGIVDGVGTGPLPGPIPNDDSEIGLLKQIRDLLAGKGGTGPLVDTAQGVGTLASGGGVGGVGGAAAPFDPVFGAKNGFLQALGFPQQLIDQWIGPAPGTTTAGATVGGLSGAGTITANPAVKAALAAFAKSGDTSALSGTGLGINDSVVTAITSARNKGKGGLSDEAISGLVEQVLGGGFSGTLDSSNTPLIKALQKFSDKGQKLPGATASTTSLASSAALTGAVPGGIDAAILSRIPAGVYTNGPGDLQKGLADCSSAVEDLANIIDGAPTGGRSLNTGNEEQKLLERGFLVNTTGANIPGALNIGMNAGHTQATLPEGTNFNWGSDAAAAAGGLNGDGAFGAGLTKQFYKMVGGVAAGGLPGVGAVGMGGAAAGATQSVFVTNWPGQPIQGGPGGPGGLGGPAGPGGATNFPGKSIIDAATQGAGAAGSDVAGQLISSILAGTDTKIGTPTGPGTDLGGLLKEGNPAAAASLFGLDVPDYTRRGGEGAVEGDPNAPSFDAKGRMFSDTGTLIDRSFTDLATQMQAQFDQTMAVFDQIKNRLGEDLLKPVVQSAVSEGIKGLGDQFTSQLGSSIGTAAAPIIAAAVKSAIPSQAAGGNTGAGGIVTAAAGLIPGMATGGPVTGGIAGRDSVPIMAMPGEHVFTTQDVARMGGQAGAYRFRKALAAGQVAGFATGGGVSGNDTVGADFFGVSQVPIIGTIINLFVKVLLKLIGVDIQVRDTLDEMSDSVRAFRGDFQKFDATGRLMNDTSGLVDRSSTSEQAAADERIRILKKVIEGIIKFIIEKVIVPIGKAIANAVVQAGATAASGAIAGAGGGPAGGIVGSAITSLGSAGIDIFADIFVDFSAALVPALIDLVSNGLQSFFPDIMNTVFGGGLLAKVFDPISNLLGGGLGGIFGGLLGGLSFDQGGIANGKGLLAKDTIEPERVLSPSNTRSFDQLPSRLDRLIGTLERDGGSRSVHVTQTVVASEGQTPMQAADQMLSLLGGN